MSDEPEIPPADQDPEPAASDASDAPDDQDNENIQTLTDFFDQMDRAAFKRVLKNRDARRDSVSAPPKSQRR